MKKRLFIAIAVAACFCIAAGSLVAYTFFRPVGIDSAVEAPAVTTTTGEKESTSTTEPSTTTKTTYPTAYTKPTISTELLATPMYPEMVKRAGGDWTEWQKSRQKQQANLDGNTDGMTDFYTQTIAAFLDGNPGENRVYSPLNVYLALSMLAETTDGNTRKQLTDLLGVSSLSTLRKKNAALWNGVYIDDGLTLSRLGNSLWLSNSGQYRYKTDTVDRLAKEYFASVYAGEMGSAAYNKQLQQWMNDQTDGLLKNQVQGIELSRETVLALVSTICFKAGWVGKFSENNTFEETFYAEGGEKTCEFMKTSEKTTAYFGKNYTAVSRGLDDGSFKMTFFLPDKDSSVDEIIRDPKMVALLEGDTGGISQRKIKVNMQIPKFDVTANYSLEEGLKSLGVTDLFDSNRCNFDGLLEGEKSLLVNADHAARVKIDEEGAEGAAYTIVTVAKTSKPPQQEEELDFVLDRPFVFAITGPGDTILFTGVVENP